MTKHKEVFDENIKRVKSMCRLYEKLKDNNQSAEIKKWEQENE